MTDDDVPTANAPPGEPAVGPGAGRRASVSGLGLIGGSIARALRARGWHVTGHDIDPATVQRALDRSIIDGPGLDPAAEITFVAAPVRAVPEAVRRALELTTGIVTDTGSVKGSVVADIDDPRFVGGHPMAGSELEGLDGADPEMFAGAVWVLTPTSTTPDAAFSSVAAVVRTFGAEVVALLPDRHDALVAVVSHVPHLTAATLMALADSRAEEHAALLRLAAGGFRDMTRIASGHPAIWLDICAENRSAILSGLDGLLAGLTSVRELVETGDRDGLLSLLTRARAARANLPARMSVAADLAEMRIAIPDRPGSAAEIFTLAAELGVNLYDFEVFHSAESAKGVLIVLVDVTAADLFRGGLTARGFRPSVRRLD